MVNFCCDRAHVWDNDLKTREENEQRAWEYIKIAEKLGAKTIRIDVGVREDSASEEQIDYVSKKYMNIAGQQLNSVRSWGRKITGALLGIRS